MIKLIIQLTRAILIAIISIFASSCRYSVDITGEQGNGNVVKQQRTLTETFSGIKASNGLEIVVEQSDSTYVEVETDENLQDNIITQVENGTLLIYVKDNMHNASARKVYVKNQIFHQLITNSGAELQSQNTLKTEHLDLETSSGSQLKVSVISKELSCDASSGSNLKVEGKTLSISCDASSGSEIEAEQTVAKSANADASSGASITLNVLEQLTADASSGASVTYVSEPRSKNISSSSGGSIRIK